MTNALKVLMRTHNGDSVTIGTPMVPAPMMPMLRVYGARPFWMHEDWLLYIANYTPAEVPLWTAWDQCKHPGFKSLVTTIPVENAFILGLPRDIGREEIRSYMGGYVALVVADDASFDKFDSGNLVFTGTSKSYTPHTFNRLPHVERHLRLSMMPCHTREGIALFMRAYRIEAIQNAVLRKSDWQTMDNVTWSTYHTAMARVAERFVPHDYTSSYRIKKVVKENAKNKTRYSASMVMPVGIG